MAAPCYRNHHPLKFRLSTRHDFLMDFFSGCQNPGSVRASSILLLYRNALRQISRLVYVQTFCNRYIVAQQLQRDHSQTADKMLVHLRHIDCEVHLIFRFILSVSSQAHQVCTTALAFQHVADGFFVQLTLGKNADDQCSLLNQADGTMLQLTRSVGLGVDVAVFCIFSGMVSSSEI